MSVFAIKILALVTMVIDHSAYYLYSSSLIGYGLYFAMRTAGRIAFPLYAFLLVNGFEKTSNRGKYLSRLVLFAAVSQLPYTIVFSQENYRLSAVSGFALLWPWCSLCAPCGISACAGTRRSSRLQRRSCSPSCSCPPGERACSALKRTYSIPSPSRSRVCPCWRCL